MTKKDSSVRVWKKHNHNCLSTATYSVISFFFFVFLRILSYFFCIHFCTYKKRANFFSKKKKKKRATQCNILIRFQYSVSCILLATYIPHQLLMTLLCKLGGYSSKFTTIICFSQSKYRPCCRITTGVQIISQNMELQTKRLLSLSPNK